MRINARDRYLLRILYATRTFLKIEIKRDSTDRSLK